MPLTLGVKTIECKIMQIWNCWAAPSWWSGKSPKLRRNVTNNYLADREFNVARKECKQNVFFQPFFVTRLILGKSDVFLCKVKYPTFDNWHFSLTRRKEHQRNLKNYTSGSNIANHAWENNHAIDFEGATVIDKGNYRVRKTLESWHTAKTVGADNNSKPLPRQYSILL